MPLIPRNPLIPLIPLGKKAPAFKLPDAANTPVSLSTFAGRPLVIYFYPKADTTSCTKEACDFNQALSALATLNAAVIGISPDQPKALAKFAAKYNLTFPLLGDVPGPDGIPTTIAKYGVWGEKSMYGRTYMGVIRTTYLIAPSGKVAARWDNVKVANHTTEVLAALAALK